MSKAIVDPKILIAEDNPANLFVLRQMLQLAGHAALTAHDGVEAVELAERTHPRLILMDISMPRMNGIDAARQIRSRSGGPDPVIVAVTANVTPQQRDACAAAGFDGFLAKPVDRAELTETLSRFLS